MPRKPPRSTEERLVRAQKSMMPGTLGGRVASASPMALDVTRLDPRLRASPASAVTSGGGFDPNADPVVIGLSADGHGQTGAVAIGSYAQTLSGDCIAIGDSAYASGDSNIAIGVSTDVRGDTSVGIGANAQVASGISEAVAIGASAYAAGDAAIAIGDAAARNTDAIAIGNGAGANADLGTAVGYRAVAGFTSSTAIGARAQTTVDNQIMLGSVSDFAEIAGDGLVLTDTSSGTRYLVQITSGALVLNTAP